MKITARELAEKHGVDQIVANSVLTFLAKIGQAKIVEQRKPEGGKGRASNVYEVGESIIVTL